MRDEVIGGGKEQTKKQKKLNKGREGEREYVDGLC
jgi:hypothetical protein